jgi:hypothetical protein
MTAILINILSVWIQFNIVIVLCLGAERSLDLFYEQVDKLFCAIEGAERV